MQKGHTMQDRRQHERFSITSLADLEVEDSGTHQEAYVMNVSRNGVGLYCHKPMELGQRVTVHLTFNHHSELHTESVCGAIIRSNPHVGVFLVGVRFDLMDESTHPELASFIDEREKQLAMPPA